jgi:VanZ family protein
MMGNGSGRWFVRNQLPAIVWALVIFVSSSIPGRVFPNISVPHVDKIVHFCYYFVLAFLVAHALQFQSRFPNLSRFSLGLSFLLATAYGVTDEMHQLFVAERSSELGDLFADMAGALVAVAILVFLRRWRKVRTGRSDGSP